MKTKKLACFLLAVLLLLTTSACTARKSQAVIPSKAEVAAAFQGLPANTLPSFVGFPGIKNMKINSRLTWAGHYEFYSDNEWDGDIVASYVQGIVDHLGGEIIHQDKGENKGYESHQWFINIPTASSPKVEKENIDADIIVYVGQQHRPINGRDGEAMIGKGTDITVTTTADIRVQLPSMAVSGLTAFGLSLLKTDDLNGSIKMHTYGPGKATVKDAVDAYVDYLVNQQGATVTKTREEDKDNQHAVFMSIELPTDTSGVVSNSDNYEEYMEGDLLLSYARFDQPMMLGDVVLTELAELVFSEDDALSVREN